jgi:phosphoribosylformimino-5-aminoimidazole carboxamide ribotide isomerase
MRIIPAIDVIGGKCVRLTQGDYTKKKIYSESPLDVAKRFEDAGLKHLHLVDLDGAKAGMVKNWELVEFITSQTSLHVDFGGGIKTDAEIKQLFELGVKQVNIGSLAVKEPFKVYQWLEKFGSHRVILSADVKNELIAISGWQENSNVSITDFLTMYCAKGLSYVTCTDIGMDGMLGGPNVALYKKLLVLFPTLKVIASGGVSSIEDLKSLKAAGVEGAIVGKAIYEEKIKLEDLQEFN